jgi:hypothetical protein
LSIEHQAHLCRPQQRRLSIIAAGGQGGGHRIQQDRYWDDALGSTGLEARIPPLTAETRRRKKTIFEPLVPLKADGLF